MGSTATSREPSSGKKGGRHSKLQELYRKMMKEMHPDLSTDAAEKKARTEFTQQANDAYDKGQGSYTDLYKVWDKWQKYQTTQQEAAKAKAEAANYSKWLEQTQLKAEELVEKWTDGLKKLNDCRAQIAEIKDAFRILHKGDKIDGCSSFKEFCTRRLNHTKQAVYAMLGGWNEKARKAAKKNKRTLVSRSATMILNTALNIHRLDNSLTFNEVIQMIIEEVRKRADKVPAKHRPWMGIKTNGKAKAAAAGSK